MNIIQAVLLGIIQGLTEFIPVSSTAHLLIAEHFLGIDVSDPAMFSKMFSFGVLVQLGTLVSLLVYYRVELFSILRAVIVAILNKKPFGNPQARLGWYLVLATIPAIIAGALLKPLVEMLFRLPLVEATIRLLVTAILLFAAERFGRQNRQFESLNWQDALWIGTWQVLSIFPGVSRSGSTIAGGMGRGFDRSSAARFAFLMSVPVLVAAGTYESVGLLKIPDLLSFLPMLLIGFITAAIVGYAAIHWLLRFLASRPLYVFSIYCILSGLMTTLVIFLAV
jgi:undecaprenyl-diphosphatase